MKRSNDKSENYRVEKHVINTKHRYYKLLDDFCFMSKNLYNFANYQVRQKFVNENYWIRYEELDKLLKQEEMNFDYKNMPLAASSQQCLKLLDKNWKSFFESIKEWKKNPDKYTGRPKLPKYLDKKGRNLVVLTNQNCKLKNGVVRFPKAFNGFSLKTKVSNGLQQVRILPRNKQIVIEVVYEIEIPELKRNNTRYYGIDIGLDNFATVVNNFGETPIVINGKGLKSINKHYNKQLSHYRETTKRMNNKDWSNRMNQITINRNNRVDNFMHQASKLVVQSAIEANVSIIVIGHNSDWKRESKMSKKVNQSFVGIPHNSFIDKVIYKAQTVGIQVVLTEESYTSGTSFLDHEDPIKDHYNKSRRRHRGLFVSNNQIKINADVNGAYQITKKVFPNAFADGIGGVGLHPVIVNVI